MNPTPHSQPESDPRNLLFISYAYQDEVFARWLARKLAFYGYGVWFDQIKLLGGESWVKDVDEAIKERSFRVLALLSRASIAKDHPRKERTMAQAVGKKLEIDDFLIPLNLDGTEPDWKVSDISWISFNHGWAGGLQRLLKKLRAIEAPRIHEGNPAIARVELDRGERLVSIEPEEIVVNWLPFTDLPETIRIFEAPGLDKESLRSWPCFMLGEGRVAALGDPPPELRDSVRTTSERHHWPSVNEIRRSSTHAIIVQILNKTVSKWLAEAGCVFTPEVKSTYLPDPFRDEPKLRFQDADGTLRRTNASGLITIKKPSAPPEKVIHHPAVRCRARRTESGSYILEVKPAVALFNHSHEPLEGRKIGPRQKKLTRSWRNHHWRKRFMIFAKILQEAAAADKLSPFALGAPIRLTADRSLIDPRRVESQVENVDETADEPTEEEIELGIEEMEDWTE